MLKRVHIKGYQSSADVEMELGPLIVLFGPTASRKNRGTTLDFFQGGAGPPQESHYQIQCALARDALQTTGPRQYST